MFSDRSRGPSLREKGFFNFFVLAIVLLFFSISPESVSAKTWYIKADGTGDAPTIQAGVDSAVVGDTVLVGVGTYDDTTHIWTGQTQAAVNVHLYKNIVLRGELSPPKVTINGWKSDAAIFVSGADSTAVIASLKIRSLGGHLGCMYSARVAQAELASTGLGIHCLRASPRIEDNEISDIGIGIFLEESRSKVCGNRFLRLHIAVWCINSTTTEMTENYFQDFWRAINAESCSNLSITNNRLNGVGSTESCDGIVLVDAPARISGNHIYKLEYDGILVANASPQEFTAQTVIEANRIERVGWSAVELNGGHNTTLTRNTFVGNALALLVNGSFGVVIDKNTFDGVGTEGIVIAGAGVDPVVENNVISRILYAIECTVGVNPIFECNDIFDAYRRYQGWPDQTGLNGNISADPEYCGIDDSGNYFLQADSPCAPGNHPDGYDCGLIGALPVNCGIVPAKKNTWGAVKFLYKKEAGNDQ